MQFITPKSHVKLFLFIAIFILGGSVSSNAQKKKPAVQPESKKTAQPAGKKEKPAAKDARKKVSQNAAVKNSVKKPDIKTVVKTGARKPLPKPKEKTDAPQVKASVVKNAAETPQRKHNLFESSLKTETVRGIAGDNFDGEDLPIRRAAVNALGSHAGTVVVMEVKTGKVLTIVNQDWGIRQSFKPCSTIKLVTGIAGTNEDLINEYGGVNSEKTRYNLNDSLAFSDNVYFQRVGKSLGSKKMIEYAQKLGLGQPTGINAENESAGRLPFGNENLRIYSHGDDFEVTPLQLAVMVSAIHNDGKIVVPRVPRTSVEKTNFRGLLRREVELPKESIESVITGMRGATKYGTARRGTSPEFNIAGKTGSCIEHNSWVGLFASVAPLEDPKYAVVVITRGQSERGRHAAAIAGKIYESLRARLFIDDAPLLLAKVKEDQNIVIAEKTAPAIKSQNTFDNRTVSVTEDEITDKPAETKFSNVVIEYKKETVDSGETENAEVKPALTRPRIVKVDKK